MQLIEMSQSDQALRHRINELVLMNTVENMQNVDSVKKIQEKKDDSDYLLLKHIIAVYGWPTYSLVGQTASYDAWLVLQHCNDSFQKACLPLLEVAVKNGQASAQNLAYLQDRILYNNGEKQIYGTQVGQVNGSGRMRLGPVENEEYLDSRREILGLEPIGVYVKQWNIFYFYKN